MKPGTRVQVPVWTDTWMMGDRFGEVVRTFTHGGHERAKVLLDKSQRTKTFLVEGLREV